MKSIKIDGGRPSPLGAKIRNEGVNFSVYVTRATSVELLLFDNPSDTEPSAIIPLNSDMHISHYYRHVFVEGIGHGQCYAYRVDGEYDLSRAMAFDKSKLLIDPYAKAVYTKNYDRSTAKQFGVENTSQAIKSVVVETQCDWDDHQRPHIAFNDLLIYELHIGGFTAHPNSGVINQGSFLGVIEKIPYLKSLGINAVELLPVFAFDDQDAPSGLSNYWGYSPINFFSLHNKYSSDGNPLTAIEEFKLMVKHLHSAGIEVILDVVYNHTAESHYKGPMLSMRGFSNESYYILNPENKSEYLDYTGCGNTFNANHSVARKMILDSLKYWVKEMHIDGFRFDLASVLSRDEDGKPIDNSPILWSIESDPELARTKLIAEAWDAKGLYQVGGFIGEKWAEWNGKYRDDIRKFVKGDRGMIKTLAARIIGSPDVFKKKTFQVSQSVHFVSCHDGFTLNDLVSYNSKHNAGNLENNNDGSNENHSNNYGVEGPSDNAEIEKLRIKQIKNFFTISLLSQGTPMILMGDEVRRTQKGNNNAYSQNNEISWFDWSLVDKNKELLNFVRALIATTREFEVLRYPLPIDVKSANDSLPYIVWHGVKNNQPDWNYNSHTLAFEYHYPIKKERIIIFMNMFWENLIFEIPEAIYGKWRMRFDTSLEQNSQCSLVDLSGKVEIESRSIVVLIDK